MATQNIKSRECLSSFVRYCVTHPEERFWQAVRNWSGYGFIYASNNIAPHELDYDIISNDMHDTFNWDGRKGM